MWLPLGRKAREASATEVDEEEEGEEEEEEEEEAPRRAAKPAAGPVKRPRVIGRPTIAAEAAKRHQAHLNISDDEDADIVLPRSDRYFLHHLPSSCFLRLSIILIILLVSLQRQAHTA